METIKIITSSYLARIIWQAGDPDPFAGINAFMYNYFYGLGGIGLWVIFFLVAIIAVVWIFYDSQNRDLPAYNWRLASVVATCLMIPTILFAFSVRPTSVAGYYQIRSEIANLERYQEPPEWRDLVDEKRAELNEYPLLTGYIEPIMFLGILGGLLPVAIAVAYYFTFQGQTGRAIEPEPYIPPVDYIPPPPVQPEPQFVPPPPPVKPKAHAWLLSRDGHNHQLNQEITTIGRSSKNDIAVVDKTTSRQHAKIMEQNNHFRIHDLGTPNGTWVNNHRIRQPVLLAHDDEIQLGDNTFFRFVTTIQ